jgi:DMSO reductase iron-sulfur subunit
MFMNRIVFSFDPSRCSGCMACIVACQDHNDHVAGDAAFRHVTSNEKGHYPSARISSFSVACLHCGDAPCLLVCPSRAIYQREKDGVVAVDRDLCVGCRSCELACPFGAPAFPEDGRMAKCDLCKDRLDRGLLPACVLVCPTRALNVGSMEEVTERKSEKALVDMLFSLTAPLGKGVRP